MERVRLRTTLMAALLFGVLMIAIYWIFGILSAPGDSIASPQPDTLLYCQAARRIVEGEPFSFAAGSLPSTGTTSVLYPFVLAIPYAMGFVGDQILSAGFVINAIFYLIFIAGWTVAFWRLVKVPAAKVLSVSLLTLFGPCIFVALSQSDIGFWMAVSGSLAAALAVENRLAIGLLIVFGPWVRPEGMVCVIAYAMVTVFWKPQRKSDYAVMALGFLSMASVFLLNHALTGECQFSSVAHKGYFKMLSFPIALHRTIADAMDMAKMLVMGQTRSMPRDMFFLPFLGAVFFWLGAIHRDWQDKTLRTMLVLVLAAGGGFLTVAQSGWQDTNYDRYIAWIMPIVIMFMAEGVIYMTSKIENLVSKWALSLLPVLFAIVGSITFAADYSYRCAKGYECQEFAKAAAGMMESTASVGGWGWSGMSYYFGDRAMAQLAGIYSPEYAYATDAERLDELRREPKKRFDYWLLMEELVSLRKSKRGSDALGPSVLLGPAGLELRKANWTAFDRAESVPAKLDGERLSDRVDVGYPKEEKSHDYMVIDRFSRNPGDAILFADDLCGQCAVDSGRLLQGGDSMTVSLTPGSDVRVVMRTINSARTIIPDGLENHQLFGEFTGLVQMNVAVDGDIVSIASVNVSSNGFSDVSFSIPGKFIRNEKSEIAFLGDHITCGYWFFQREK